MTTASQTTKHHRIFTARQVKESLDESSGDTFYFFIGQLDAPTPPIQNTLISYEEELRIWNNMIELKRISASDVQHVIPRNDWATGTTYNAYTNAIQDIHSYGCYALTSENRMYMCMSNNSSTASTVEPTSTGLNTQTTSDGYVWKYLYTIDPLSSVKFIDIGQEWIPVLPDPVVQQNATGGSIYSVNILDPGNYGSNASPYSLDVISSSGTDFDANTSLTYFGTVEGFDLISGGTYNANGNVEIFSTSYLGSGLEAYATIENNTVVSINVVTPGTWYEYIDAMWLDHEAVEPTVNAVFTPLIREYGATSVNIINSGNNYSDVSLSFFHPDANANATFDAILTPLKGLGYDPAFDLDAKYLMFNSKMSKWHDGDKFVGGNSYYFKGILINPVESSNVSALAHKDKYIQIHQLGVSGVTITGSVTNGQTITQSYTNATAKVVYHDTTSDIIFVTDVVGEFSAAGEYSLTTSGGAIVTRLTSVTNPELVVGSGRIIYTEISDTPLTRDPLQGEDYKVVIEY